MHCNYTLWSCARALWSITNLLCIMHLTDIKILYHFTSNYKQRDTIILVGYLIDYAEYQNGCWSSISCVFLTHLNSIHQRHFSIIMHLRQTKICDKIEYYLSTNSYWWNEVIILVWKFLLYKAVSYEARCIEYYNTSSTFKRDQFFDIL